MFIRISQLHHHHYYMMLYDGYTYEYIGNVYMYVLEFKHEHWMNNKWGLIWRNWSPVFYHQLWNWRKYVRFLDILLYSQHRVILCSICTYLLICIKCLTIYNYILSGNWWLWMKYSQNKKYLTVFVPRNA